MIDLQQSEENLWSGINGKKRNKIRKAKKNDVSILISAIDSKALILDLIQKLHNKLGSTVIDLQFYDELIDHYLPKKQMEILIATYKNAPVSGVLMAGNKNFMHYWKGASVPEKENMGQGELLQWESILRAKENNSTFYDLCVVDKINHPRIYEYKTAFSQHFYPFEIIQKSPFVFKIINRIRNFVS